MGWLGDKIKDKTRRTCPTCKGRGHIPLQKTTKKKGWETVDRKHYAKVKCPLCKGKGTILG